MRFYSLGQLSREDKDNILNKHKELYNGYRRIHEPVNNESPLFVQDFANDKVGVTINGSGDVSGYSNKIYMKESKEQMCPECSGMMYEGECSECGYAGMEEGIHDVEDLNKKNKFDYVEEELDEIDSEKLEKGKKYKFKSPSYEDDIEYLGQHDFESGEPHHTFRGKDKTWHSMGKKGVEYFLHDIDDEEPIKEYEQMESAFADELEEIEGPLYSKVDPAYDFKSDGPMQAKGPYAQNEEEDIIDLDDIMSDEDERDTAFSRMRRGHKPEDIEWEDIHKDRESAFDKMKRGKTDIEDIDWEDIDDDIKESLILQKHKINEMFNRFKKYN